MENSKLTDSTSHTELDSDALHSLKHSLELKVAKRNDKIALINIKVLELN